MLLSAIEIEKSVIGSWLIDEKTIYHISELTENDFTVNAHKVIFKEAKELAKKKMLDLVSLAQNIKQYDVQISYLTQLTVLAQPYSIENHISILRSKTKKRKLIQGAQDFIDGVAEDGELDKLLYEFETSSKKIIDADSNIKDDITSITNKFLDYIENTETNNINFGLKFLDEVIGGLYKGELTTIAAKSGVGKTALALMILRSCLKQNKTKRFY